MKVAIFGKDYTEEQKPYFQLLLNEFTTRSTSLCIYKPFYDRYSRQFSWPNDLSFFVSHIDLVSNADILFSIGGDGTFLDTIPLVRGSGIPILGINLGRLGFLSSISKDDIKGAIDSIYVRDYDIEKRTLLSLDEPKEIFGDLNFALNDLTIYRNNTTSLIVVHVYVDGKILNSYWGDGLIVSTPTGSTAYSLAAGGPILTPGSENFIIAPIASHNLTVRPIVIQDSCEIRIRIEGREEKYLMTMDSRHSAISREEELVIRRCDFQVALVQMKNQDFFSTIRDKLMWGKDYRN